MNKTFRTVLITIFILLLLQFIYLKTASFSSLITLTTSIKNFPNKEKFTIAAVSKKDFEVIEVKTGLKETSTLWFPTVFVRLKNNSSSDIVHHHELKVVYIDSYTTEVINSDDCDISSSTELFPKGTNRKFELTTTLNFDIAKERYKKEMRGKKIQAKLYLDDELIGSYPVKSKVIYFNKF